ncbi:hypothetical protein TI39_contig634g00001 [Zymoseptoria brevis]|uniref:D-isomer specific 2-hydroxyacid dehydrogenase NAD-binding domain-containing protein n=1 Tax=Zymoseptoria brevis TaxID=1047168 RepID=A0A0F4GJM6_9PEZI|nr:hypothetical protein TI39_contig634g00001 [Zymoseptoria brevis]
MVMLCDTGRRIVSPSAWAGCTESANVHWDSADPPVNPMGYVRSLRRTTSILSSDRLRPVVQRESSTHMRQGRQFGGSRIGDQRQQLPSGLLVCITSTSNALFPSIVFSPYTTPYSYHPSPETQHLPLTMIAPGLIDPVADTTTPISSSTTKPILYMIDSFYPAAILYAQSLFTCILPSNPKIHNWRSNAQYLLVEGSHITASDFASTTHLFALGKQGVGPRQNRPESSQTRRRTSLQHPRRKRPNRSGTRASPNDFQSRNVMGSAFPAKRSASSEWATSPAASLKFFHLGLNCKIVAYDPFAPADAWGLPPPPPYLVRLRNPFPQADVLTVHVPLNDGTRNLIGINELRMCKRTAIVINAARGGIVNEDGLATALEEYLIWGAGLDCHEEEPPSKERYQRLWSHPRVVSTPHIGAATSQAQEDTAKAAVDAVDAYYRREGGK